MRFAGLSRLSAQGAAPHDLPRRLRASRTFAPALAPMGAALLHRSIVALARTNTYHRADIRDTLLNGVNNGRTESLSTKVQLIARRAFGFRSAPALIALSELAIGGLCPSLPGRQTW
jgi:hypothetical protein